MNPETLIQNASFLIESAKFGTSPFCHLCFWDNTLCCFPTNHTTINHTVFLVFSEGAKRVGLSINDWNVLRAELWKVFKEKI